MARTLPALQPAHTRIIEAVARRGGSNVRLFGSHARDEANATVDVDLLVDLPASLSRGEELMVLLGLGKEVSELTGLRVHVASERLLLPEVRLAALREARQL